ncbi:MAG: penicillin-binding protein 2 [Deltaproteobacteria bacterium]|nr:penicillin-binding protein 2 [Deltaproteobacteria bacterium]
MREARIAPLGLQDPAPPITVRLGIIGLIIFFAFVLLVARLWQLQGIEGQEFRTLSENNRLRLKRTPPLRGVIYDRRMREMVNNRPAFNVVLVPEDVPDLPTTLATLAEHLRDPTLLGTTSIPQDLRRLPYQGVVLAQDVTRDALVAIEARQVALPGVSIDVGSKRVYPPDGFAAHLLGYVGQVNASELQRFRKLKLVPEYRLGDILGKFGIEKRWETGLRGEGGGQQIEVDANGHRLRVLDSREAKAGESLVLTIDVDLQHAAETALQGKEGAIVMLDVNTGEVLAMASHPSFDPNLFARGIRTNEWHALVDDPLRPLNNRAVQGQYPPGSTFKVIMGAAALEKGVVTPTTRFHCSGGLQFGGHRFRCWKRRGHGSMNLQQAIAHSCDVYFYQVGQRLGIQNIADYARLFGMGKPLGVGLDHEASGLIPDGAWKSRVLKAPWLPGETLSVVIGQGYVTATPLQMAVVAATVANGGIVYRPHVVKQTIGVGGEIKEYAPEVFATAHIQPEIMQLVRDGMRDVVNSGGATGGRAKLPNVVVAGKTGTSQVISGTRGKGKIMARQFRDHAWFIAFAPFERPEVAVAVVVEHAGAGGGQVAAPMVREVLDTYFKITPRTDHKPIKLDEWVNAQRAKASAEKE